MENQTNDKKRIGKIGRIFFVLVLLLTFFSKTVANMMLPTVRACIPQKGNLSKEVESEASLQFKQVIPIYAPINSKVVEVYVNEGDKVEKGQALCQLDIKNLELEIENAQMELEKTKLNLEILSTDIQIINKKIIQEQTKLKQKNAEALETHLEEKLKIEDAKIVLKTNESLFSEGMISEKELREAKINLANLEKEISNKIKEESENKQDKIDESKESLERLNSEKLSKSQEMQLKKIELELAQNNIKTLLEKKQTSGIVTADEAGTVLRRKEDENIAAKNEIVNEAEILMKLGIDKEGFSVKFKVDKEVNFIHKGDEVNLKIGDKSNIQGEVESIKVNKEEQEVLVKLQDEDVREGEIAKTTFKEEGLIYNNVIPYSALYKESDYYYVYTIQSVDDALGNAYSLKKKKVYVEDYNNEYVAIREGVNALDWVMVTSEKEVKEGTRVRIENENEVLRNE